MRKGIVIFGLLIIAAVIGYNYIYQDHRDIVIEAAEFSMPSSKIALQFSENATTAEQKYLNKTIEVSGRVTEISSNELTIDDSVFCQFRVALPTSKSKNSTIKIKGRVIGYDDLLEQVKLDQCTIIK